METTDFLTERFPVAWKRLSYTLKWRRIIGILVTVILFSLFVLTFWAQDTFHKFRSTYPGNNMPQRFGRKYVDTLQQKTTSQNEAAGSTQTEKNFREIDLSLLALDGFYPDVPNSRVAKTLNDFENPDLSFAIVIDCGSSGSRLFVYKWDKHSGNPNDLLKIDHMRTQENKIVVRKVEPGISSFAPKPYEIVRYITPLLRFAEKNVPTEKHSTTPLFILCTAGMRLLSEGSQNRILEALRNEIPLITDFLFEHSHAEVISGKHEGLYSWVSLNYVLGRFDSPSKNSSEKTAGVIDMGGGSLQIAYKVSDDNFYNAREHTMDINLSGTEKNFIHRHKVYVETFLGKGANSVRKAYEESLINKVITTTPVTLNSTTHILEDPCMPKGLEKYLKTLGTTPVTLSGTGDFTYCKSNLIQFLDKSSCKNSTECIMDGEIRPKIDFKNSSFFGISEFYYTMEDVLKMSGNYNKEKFDKQASAYCDKEWNESYQEWRAGQYPIADEFRMQTQCFKSAWMSLVFHDGLNFPHEYDKFKSVKIVNNNEIQWTLGALLYKTRFLPLREIQQAELKQKVSRTNFLPFLYISQNPSILILCIIIVSFSVLLYGLRFWLSHNQHRVASLKRVGSSVAYFVHEDIV